MPPKANRPSPSPLVAVRTSVVLVCSALTLAACTSLDVQAYPGAERPESQVAKLQPLSARILSIDGAAVEKQCGGRVAKNCNVVVLPGLHSMQVQPMSATGGEGPTYIAPTVATPGMFLQSSAGYVPVGHPVTVKYVFMAGHDYTLFPFGTCVPNPAATSPQERAASEHKGVCLMDNTTKQGVPAQ